MHPGTAAQTARREAVSALQRRPARPPVRRRAPALALPRLGHFDARHVGVAAAVEAESDPQWGAGSVQRHRTRDTSCARQACTREGTPLLPHAGSACSPGAAAPSPVRGKHAHVLQGDTQPPRPQNHLPALHDLAGAGGGRWVAARGRRPQWWHRGRQQGTLWHRQQGRASPTGVPRCSWPAGVCTARARPCPRPLPWPPGCPPASSEGSEGSEGSGGSEGSAEGTRAGRHLPPVRAQVQPPPRAAPAAAPERHCKTPRWPPPQPAGCQIAAACGGTRGHG